jgi:hypothetical protein
MYKVLGLLQFIGLIAYNYNKLICSRKTVCLEAPYCLHLHKYLPRRGIRMLFLNWYTGLEESNTGRRLKAAAAQVMTNFVGYDYPS